MSRVREQYIEEIMEAMYCLRRTFVSQWVKEGGSQKERHITPSQWMALIAVARTEDISITGLAEMLGITASAATQLVDELTTKGCLVRRGKVSDRRSLSLALSQKVKKKIEDMKAKQLDRFMHVFDCLTNTEIKQYAALNKKIAEHLHQK